MPATLIQLIFVSILYYACFGQEFEGTNVDIYWREYTGIIPKDAVPGGHDINNKTTYIGHGFVNFYGIIVGMIYPGEKKLTVHMDGVRTVDNYVMILCSTQRESFKWIPATLQNFHLLMINKYPVRGGYERTYTLNIGRVAYLGELVVGKIVTGFIPGQAPMFYISQNKGHRIESYEALIYVPKDNYTNDVRSERRIHI